MYICLLRPNWKSVKDFRDNFTGDTNGSCFHYVFLKEQFNQFVYRGKGTSVFQLWKIGTLEKLCFNQDFKCLLRLLFFFFQIEASILWLLIRWWYLNSMLPAGHINEFYWEDRTNRYLLETYFPCSTNRTTKHLNAFG